MRAMKMTEEGVELLLQGIWLDMGMGQALPVVCTQLKDIPGLGTDVLGDALNHDVDVLRVVLRGVEKRDVRETYEIHRQYLQHPAYKNAPLEIVGRFIGCS